MRRPVTVLSLSCLVLSLPALAAAPGDLKNDLKSRLAEARMEAEQTPLAVEAPRSPSKRLQKFFEQEKAIDTAPVQLVETAPTQAPSEMMDTPAKHIPIATKQDSAHKTTIPPKKEILGSISDKADGDDIQVIKASTPEKTAVAKPVAKIENAAPKAVAVPSPVIATPNDKAPILPPVVKTEQKTVLKTERIDADPALKTQEGQVVPSVAAAPKPAYLAMPQTITQRQPLVVETKKHADAIKEVDIKQAVPAVPVVPVASTMTAMVTPAPSAITTITAPETTAAGAWRTRMIAAQSDKEEPFCVMENKFTGNVALMIGQRADGYSTIGINYGIDMLVPGKSYSALVQVDQDFEENFNAFAQSGHMLIVQLGKKPSLFALLGQAQNLRIAVPGSASNFAIQGLTPALENFDKCLKSIGGSLPVAQAVPIMTAGQNMPAVTNATVDTDTLTPPPAVDATPAAAPQAAPVIAAAPLQEKAPVAQTTKMAPPPQIIPAIIPPAGTPVPAKAAEPVLPHTMAQTAPNAMPAVAPVMTKATTPAPTPVSPAPQDMAAVGNVPTMLPQQAAMIAQRTITAQSSASALPAPVTGSEWSAFVHNILNRANTPVDAPSFKQGAAAKEWTEGHGRLKGEVWRVPGNDLLNAALAQVDVNDEACHGAYSNQLGAPETVDGNAVQLMETKCVTGETTMISTWVLQQSNAGITAWRMTAPQGQQQLAFDARARILNALKQPTR